MRKVFNIISFLFVVQTLSAQSMKDILNRTKTQVQQQATQKVNQKIDQSVDKAADKAMVKIFGKSGSVFTANNPGAPVITANQKRSSSTKGKINENGEIIIATNIKCTAGKKMIEEGLTDTPGISAALVDTDSGLLFLTLTGKLSSYEEVTDMIRKNGFTADGKKSISGTNPCK